MRLKMTNIVWGVHFGGKELRICSDFGGNFVIECWVVGNKGRYTCVDILPAPSYSLYMYICIYMFIYIYDVAKTDVRQTRIAL